jgi:RNA polymerase sigma-70 factor (ECF subfamily)
MFMDSQIVRLHAAGDREEAMRLFATEYEPRLLAVSRRLVRSEDEARDAVQESLIQIDRSLPRFEGGSSLYTWAFRIAVNVCLNLQRGLRANATHVELDAEAESAEPDPDTMCVQTFRASVVERAMRRLPDAQRVALALCDLEEMTAPEAAAVLGIDANAVKARVRRGRAALRELIAQEYRRRGVNVDNLGAITCVSDFLSVGPALQPAQSRHTRGAG